MPLVPLIPPVSPGAIDDALAKDEKLRVSQLLREETGWRGRDLRTAAAIMGPESGYNAGVVNNRAPCSANGDHAVGLLQMCTVHKGKFGIPLGYDDAVKWLQNPRNNVRAAYKLWLVQGWGAWAETYRTGAYQKYLGQDPVINAGKRTVSGSAGGAIVDAADSVLGPVDEFVGALLNPSTWLRVGKGGLGITFIGIGVSAMAFVIIKKSAKSPAGKAAIGALPAGKAAKAVKAVT